MATDFSWGAAAALSGLPDRRGLNLAHEAVDRHATGGRDDQVALRFLGPDSAAEDLTFSDLCRRTNRFANVLATLGVRPGETVATLCGRSPELFVVALGALKHRAVFCPLFTSFGPVPLASRLRKGRARVLVTTAALYERKVAAMRNGLPELRHVLLVDAPRSDAIDWRVAMSTESDRYEIGPTGPEEAALLHFTSGTTGMAKGAIHVHAAGVVPLVTAGTVLDLHDGDVFWCTADPAWVTGTSYGILAPLLRGVTTVVDQADFDGCLAYLKSLGVRKVRS